MVERTLPVACGLAVGTGYHGRRIRRVRHLPGFPMNASAPPTRHETRDGSTPACLRDAFLENLYYAQAKFPAVPPPNARYMALAYTARARVARHAVSTFETYYRTAARTVSYLSAEYLLGPHLGNNLIN